MDLLQALGISPPAADGAVCYEIYDETFVHGAPEEQLDALAVRCMQLVLPCIDGYIWQHDPFRLHSSIKQPSPWVLKKRGKAQQQQQQQSDLPCLWGVVRYDDNVEDEWFVVWLLLELSRQITTLCCRIWDDDGDFLLIEAAYSLPRWLKPETATNRVWLRCGGLHIIPQQSSRSASLPQQPTTREALHILASGILDTRRPKVEVPALSRARVYPDALHQSRQRVLAWLPRRVGRLLQEDPQMVAAAVTAFITRTRDEVQSAARWRMFAHSDMTTVLVTMNRCQYAQLTQEDLTTPKGYPPAPTTAAAGAGAAAASWLGGDERRQQKALDLGIKIHTGMEIMCLRMGLNSSSNSNSSNTTSQDAAAAAEHSPSQATSANTPAPNQQQQQQRLTLNPAWHHYLTVLRQSGYFSGEVQGSVRYKQLMAAAQTAFLESGVHLRSTEVLAGPTAHMQALLLKLDQQQQGVLTPQQSEGGRSAAAAVLDADGLFEDSDSWMQDAAAAVQQQLAAAEAEAAAHEARKQQRRAGPAAAGGSQQESESQQPQQQQQNQQGGSSNDAGMVDAEQLVAAIRGFVDHATAGPEGAEVQQSRNSTAAAAAAARSAGSDVQFDPDAFLAELMGICGTAGSSSSKKQQQQDPNAVFSQLQSLQQRLLSVIDNNQDSAAVTAAAADRHPSAAEDDDVDSEYDTSSSEGSSFYGSDDGNDETLDDDQLEDGHAGFSTALGRSEAHQQEPVQLPVPPPVSGIHKQQQQQKPEMQQQQYKLPPSFRGSMLQAAEYVVTDTDSDDEDNLSLGGSDDSRIQSDGDMSESEGSSHEKSERRPAQKREEMHFYDAYDAALESELAGTAMAQSFGKFAVQEPASAAAAAGSSAGRGLRPVDIDMNLIKSLVASYSAQGGLPGPASNLAGLLGLQLPTEVVEDK